MSFYEYKVLKSNGDSLAMNSFEGKKVLIVNTASRCGFTPQYEGLQKLYEENKESLVILAFPCNQFGAQEPGSDQEIGQFCEMNYNITFPILKKVDVNGDNAEPLFTYLKKELPGLMGTEQVKWNFTKFLIDEKGNPVKRFAPKDSPEDIKKYI